MRPSTGPLRHLKASTFLTPILTPITLAPHQLHLLSPRSSHSPFPLLTAPPSRLPPWSPRRSPSSTMSVFFDRLLNTYSKVSDALTFNAATLSGAIDIIVIHHSDDTFKSTPFHVRFGKLQLLKSREKLVSIRVNGVECQWKMKLGHAGEAFFVLDAGKQQPATEEELASPITSPLLAPAATLSTAHGTITPINPAPHTGPRADSGRPKSSHPHEEHKAPDPPEPPHYTLTRNRVVDVVDAGHARSVSEAGLERRAVRVHLTPSSRLKEEEDERTVASELAGGEGGVDAMDDEVEEEMRWTQQHRHESKDDMTTTLRLTRQSFSAPLSPHSPMSPLTPTSSSSTTASRSQAFSDTSTAEGPLPPADVLRSAASMEPTLSPAPSSPRSPSSPSFFPNDDERILSAPSATDALEHVYTWTWGHLPVHHQRFHPNDHSKTEQPLHSPPPIGTSPLTVAAMSPPQQDQTLPTSPLHLAAAGSTAPSVPSAIAVSSIYLKGDVVKELKHEAAAAAASLQQPTQPPVDSRSWSVRGIFSSVFSKLPARASFSMASTAAGDLVPAAGGGVGEVKDEVPQPPPDAQPFATISPTSDAAEPPPTQSPSAVKLSLSPTGSINLAEAHLPVPWLNRVDADTASSLVLHPSHPAPSNLSSPATATGLPAPPSTLPPSSLSSPQQQSDRLTSPLSAPLPSSSTPAFALPSQARPSSAMEGSLFHPSQTDDRGRPPSRESTHEAELQRSAPPSPALSSSLEPSSLRLSLCGHLLGSHAEMNRAVFEQHSISYQQLASQPELTFRSDLVVLYQQRLYPSRIALPLILSHLAFGRPLAIAQDGLERLSAMTLPHPPLINDPQAPQEAVVGKGKTEGTTEAISTGPEAAGRSWRDWFRYRDRKVPPPIDTVSDLTQRTGASAILSATQSLAVEGSETEAARAPLLHSKSVEPVRTAKSVEGEESTATPTTITISAPNGTHFPSTHPPPSTNATAPSRSTTSPAFSSSSPSSSASFIKSLRPTSSMLASLRLHPGRNSVTFSVSSALQGQQTVSASIYLWAPDEKIVVSDIDGTITKSDILGHVMPLVGRDWSHVGVTQLYSDIHRNGYQLLYLTSRAIGQANVTRGYIQGLRQGESSLPFGPVIMSPDRLLHSFKREVIHRRPQEFKIIALKDVRALFDDDYCPFYAGFGNRITDAVAYRAVSVPPSRIFIINHNGVIQHLNVHYSKSYPELGGLVNAMFPSILAQRVSVEEEYNAFQYWRTPMAKLSEDEESDDDDDDDDDSEEEEEELEEAAQSKERADGAADGVGKVSADSAGEAERKEFKREADVIASPRTRVIGTV